MPIGIIKTCDQINLEKVMEIWLTKTGLKEHKPTSSDSKISLINNGHALIEDPKK